MALTDYTTYDTIRAVVGVAEEEILDETLAQPLYASEVTFALEDLNETIPSKYTTIKGIPEGDRTLVQKRFYELVGLYAAYTVAKVLLGGSIEMFAPRKITDSKASQERVEDPFSNLRADVSASLAVWESRLAKTLTQLDPTQTVSVAPVRVYVATAGLALDPVTGA